MENVPSQIILELRIATQSRNLIYKICRIFIVHNLIYPVKREQVLPNPRISTSICLIRTCECCRIDGPIRTAPTRDHICPYCIAVVARRLVLADVPKVDNEA